MIPISPGELYQRSIVRLRTPKEVRAFRASIRAAKLEARRVRRCAKRRISARDESEIGRALQSAAQQLGVSVDALRGRGKGTRLVESRRLAMQELRRIGLTYAEIGLVLNRHFSTVMNAIGGEANDAR